MLILGFYNIFHFQIIFLGGLQSPIVCYGHQIDTLNVL